MTQTTKQSPQATGTSQAQTDTMNRHGKPDDDRARGTLTTEPTVQFATVRDGDNEWHIECRFSDGQKFAAVTIAKPFEQLAHNIADFLNGEIV